MDSLFPPILRRDAVLEVVSPQRANCVAEPEFVGCHVAIANDFLRCVRRVLETFFASFECLLCAAPELAVASLIERPRDGGRKARQSIFENVIRRTFAQSLYSAL